MDDLEEVTNKQAGVRRTRSGRLVRPTSATKTAKKKKKVMVEIEVSDDDELNHSNIGKVAEQLSESLDDSAAIENESVEEDKILESENSAEDKLLESETNEEKTALCVEITLAENDTVEEANESVEETNEKIVQENQLITPEATNFDIDHSDNTNDNLESHINNQNSDIDNCSNTARFPEGASNVDSELNTFKGAIGNTEKNDKIFTYKTVESSSVIDQQNEESLLLENQDSLSNQDNYSELEPKETKPDLMDCSEDGKEMSEAMICDTQDSIIKEESLPIKQELPVPDNVEKGNSEMDTAENGGPDTEVISEDELPGVQVAKVPETEEVSDEELPGPKRAELPADTEVVSEDELPTVKKESGKRKLSALDYDPGSPTSENESASKKPNLEVVESEKEKEEKVVKPKKLPELDKYWKAVNDDPADFTGWTYLLQYVDQENDTEAAREAYDAFLSHYPYCYGYWRKYADYEKRKGNKKRCEEVFERGLKAIPLSVDLWIHYLTYVRATRGEDEEFIRSQYERSLNMCGLEFRSDRLWDSYIKWETEAKRLQHVTAIYDRLLATPTQGYTTHFDNFQEHIASYPPKKVLEVDEFLALRKEVKHILKHDAPAEPDAEKTDAPPGEDDTDDVVSSDEETKVIRERIISIRRKIHKNTINAVTARWGYEEGIKRPYFHVKPLERCQLKNWHDYLDFEIAQNDENKLKQTRIIVLFERCLIACALYEEFWLKFVHYLNELKDPEMQPKLKDVYERACTIHHLKKPNLHLQWAIFEESLNNFNRAAEILVNLEKSVPNLLQVAYRRINLERRKNDYEKCCQLYEHYINNSKSKIISSNIAIKYARFCHKVLKNIEKAVETINLAITKDPHNARLYLQLIDLSMQKGDIVESEILSYIDSFLEKEGVDIDQKILFAQRKLEFLEDFGTSIDAVQKAQDEYQKYLKTGKDNKKKDISKVDSTSTNKKDKNQTVQSSQSNSYGNYGNYSNSSAANSYNQYSGSQQGQYNYSQYNQNDQYQYQNWQYPQGNYSGYNQWSGYSGGYSY